MGVTKLLTLGLDSNRPAIQEQEGPRSESLHVTRYICADERTMTLSEFPNYWNHERNHSTLLQSNSRNPCVSSGNSSACPIPAGMAGSELRARRREARLHAGYRSASPSTDQTEPRRPTGVDRWWDTKFQAAEYQPDGAEYPQMPDDYTPKFKVGRSISGHRRTHRILYEGAGVALRMPSASAMKRFAYETPGTFDVARSATYPGGQVTETVRVTDNGWGLWSVSGNGLTPEQAAYVTETVSTVLEARRPSLGFKATGDLLERRRARFAAGGIKFDRTPSLRSSPVSLSPAVRDGGRSCRCPVLRLQGPRASVQSRARIA
ncbi:hypothetical protein GCM10025780_29490 [Frondihabitans cladoniiphilus]|uniref:Uncharacterized protein n=1 Tax=Frondihabitans cladoniiphilus TaxID=715785 RepID=A0ABP8W6L5_9MICO